MSELKWTGEWIYPSEWAQKIRHIPLDSVEMKHMVLSAVDKFQEEERKRKEMKIDVDMDDVYKNSVVSFYNRLLVIFNCNRQKLRNAHESIMMNANVFSMASWFLPSRCDV